MPEVISRERRVRKRKAIASGLTSQGAVTTSQLCAHFKITGQHFHQLRYLGIWKIEPLMVRAGLAGESLWDLKAADRSAPAVVKLPAARPREVELLDGKYILIAAASGHYDESTGRWSPVPLVRPRPAPSTIKNWIDLGCDLFIRYDDDPPRKLRGHSLEFRSPFSVKGRTARYVHEGDFNGAMSVRKNPERLAKPYVRTRRAMLITGLTWDLFKQMVEDPAECRRRIGHAAGRAYVPTINGFVVHSHLMWLEADMEAMRKSIDREVAEHANMLTDPEAREKFPGLPPVRIKTFKQICPYLPNKRGVRFLPKVLRRTASGALKRCDVYDPEDLAIIERVYRDRGEMVISRSRGRVVARGYKLVEGELSPPNAPPAEPRHRRGKRGRPATEKEELRRRRIIDGAQWAISDGPYKERGKRLAQYCAGEGITVETYHDWKDWLKKKTKQQD